MTLILSALVLVAFALFIGGIFLGRRDGWSIKPVLMIVLGLVMLGNAAILSIPNERGLSPADADFQS